MGAKGSLADPSVRAGLVARKEERPIFYLPTQVAKMWDTWLYYHEGVHYLYYLHETTGARFDGMSVVTSADGVHFKEIGSIVEVRDDAEWLGTGSVWEAGGRFVMNYSEQREGVQAIFFRDARFASWFAGRCSSSISMTGLFSVIPCQSGPVAGWGLW